MMTQNPRAGLPAAAPAPSWSARPGDGLTAAQLDGHACAECGVALRPGVAFIPAGYVPGSGQLFRCADGCPMDAAPAVDNDDQAPAELFEMLPEHMPPVLVDLLDRVPDGRPRIVCGVGVTLKPGVDVDMARVEALCTKFNDQMVILLPPGTPNDHLDATLRAASVLIRRGPVPAGEVCVIERVASA